MPNISVPSLTQQRVILVFLSLAIIGLGWWQSATYDENHPVQKFSSTSIPGVVATLDFANVESAWSGLTLDSQGNLQIDSMTETALSDAIALIRNQTPESNAALATTRVAFLLEKQFGVTASRQAMELLPKLQQYKEAERRWMEVNGSENPPPYDQLFQLQNDVFGTALAEKIFSEQRRLTKVMLATHRIQNDSRLTKAEKDRALMEVQKTFRAEDAE